MSDLTCDVCFHHCVLKEGKTGRCRTRSNVNGENRSINYGKVTSLGMDPIEKKPLVRFHPGSYILSCGFFGCNFACPFCQNWEIAQAGAADVGWQEATPEALVALGERLHAKDPRMIGIAHTYNEPLVSWEFVRDTALLAREAGLATVLVSNGCATAEVVDALAPLVDTANIDLKSFSPAFYEECGGSLELAQATIQRLAAEPGCHLEVTTLVVNGKNDTPAEMDELAAWLASVDPGIVLHVTRFFPRWKLTDRLATPVRRVYELADVARRHLSHVHVGNC